MDKPLHLLDLRVSCIERYSPRLFLLELAPTEGMPDLPPSYPGQFLQIRVPDAEGVFLRRPLSVYYSTPRSLGLLIQVAGKATEHLYRSEEGDVYNVLYPLGNHFSAPVGAHPLLVGGGVGLAPMLSLGAWLKEQGYDPTFLLGGRDASSFPALDRFDALGTLLLTTEDGSVGDVGRVTDHSLWRSFAYSDIYCCGPTPMMKAVAKLARTLGVPSQVSLENLMACGVGVCLCCVEPTTSGHRCVCVDGPVFTTDELKWE